MNEKTFVGEKILMEGIANPVSGLIVKNGHGILTNARFAFCKHSLAKTLTIGAFVNLTQGSYEYDIPLEDIATVVTERFRLGHALTITKKDGTVFKYGILKPKEWQFAFEHAMSGLSDTSAPETEMPSEKKFCSSCGAKLEPGVRFCSSCGAKV